MHEVNKLRRHVVFFFSNDLIKILKSLYAITMRANPHHPLAFPFEPPKANAK